MLIYNYEKDEMIQRATFNNVVLLWRHFPLKQNIKFPNQMIQMYESSTCHKVISCFIDINRHVTKIVILPFITIMISLQATIFILCYQKFVLRVLLGAVSLLS